jgi:ankyrin repeat protein
MTPEEVLRKAVKERHCQGVKRAFEAKANVNATDDTGWTSLHHTAYHGFGEIVDLLLGHPDIDVTVETPNHETARDLAFIACHDNIVHKLDARRQAFAHVSRVTEPKPRHAEALISTKGRPRSLFD